MSGCDANTSSNVSNDFQSVVPTLLFDNDVILDDSYILTNNILKSNIVLPVSNTSGVSRNVVLSFRVDSLTYLRMTSSDLSVQPSMTTINS